MQRDEQESRAPLDVYPGYAFTPDSKAVIVYVRRQDLARAGRQERADEDSRSRRTSKLDDGPGGEVRVSRRHDARRSPSHQIRDIAPSPDGKKLAFTALDRLYVMDLPSGTPQRVTTGRTSASSARVVARLEVDRVRDVERSGRRPDHARDLGEHDRRREPTITQLTRNRGLYTDLAWSPDGDRIVVDRAAAREMQDAGAAFFGPAAADFVWIPAAGGNATLIMPPAGIGNPHFTTNPDRIYAYGPRDGLVSFRWDGTDMQARTSRSPAPCRRGDGERHAMTLDAGLVDDESKRWVGARAAHMVTARRRSERAEPAAGAAGVARHDGAHAAIRRSRMSAWTSISSPCRRSARRRPRCRSPIRRAPSCR